MPIAFLTLLGLLLRLHGLHQSPWYDEAQTIDLIKLPFARMMHRLPKEQATPPLYYMLGRIWVRIFGNGVVSFRIFSVASGIVTVPLAGLTARRVLPNTPRAAVIVTALAAFSPELVWYSQEIRPYSLMLCLTTAGLLAFTYARERPTMRNLAIWSVLSGLAMGTQYFSAVIIAPEAVYLIYRYRKERAVWVGMGILAVFLVAVAKTYLDLSPKLPFAYITVFDLGTRIGQVFSQALIGQGAPLWPLFKFLAFACVIGALALLYYRGTAREKRASKPPLILAAIGLGLPILAAVVGTDRLITRDLLPLWVPAMIFLAACLGVRRAPRIGAALTVALCAIGIFVSLAVVQNTFLQRPDWQGVADTLGTKAPTHDGKPTRRVVMVINNQGVLQMGLFMKQLGAYRGWKVKDVTEVDFVVARSPHKLGLPNCWWGSGCQIGPMSFSRAFRRIKVPGEYVTVKKHGKKHREVKRVPHFVLSGFHRVGVTKVHQFSIMKFQSNAPVTLTKGMLRNSIRKDPYIESQLIVQGPDPKPFKLPS